MDIQTEFAYQILNPAPKARAGAVEALQILKAKGFFILGFEVTIAELAALCDRNIDPQHTGQQSQQSAIRETLESLRQGCLSLPPKTAFVTIRADLDAIGAMAIAKTWGTTDNEFREEQSAAWERIEAVHKADCFLHGHWQPRELFSDGYESSLLCAIARAVADHAVPPAERVSWMAEWLRFGWEPEGYREKAETEQKAIADALASGETSVYVDGSIAVVQSKLMAATAIAYSKAPIGIAFNPWFPWKLPDGKIQHVIKASIFQYEEGWLDMAGVLAELQAREPGWNGSPTFIGSTQGASCLFPLGELLAIVQRHTKEKT